MSCPGKTIERVGDRSTGPAPPPPTFTLQLPSGGTCPQANFSSSNFDAGPPATCSVGFATGTREVEYKRQISGWECFGTTNDVWYKEYGTSWWYAACDATEVDPGIPWG